MLSPNFILQERYRIVRLLGEGGMGAVYEAIDQRVSCLVALKETLMGTDEESKQAFQREAALLANLRHSALPKVMDYFSEGEGLFLVMEYIPGYDLAELLELRGSPFPQDQVLRWADELLKVLQYLHTRHPPILHRDIKPANLKLTKQGEIFLLDFGLAKGAAGQMPTIKTSKSVRGYTPVFSSLEQIHGKGTDPRSDLYSLGATLYTMLTGQAPVDAPTRFAAAEDEEKDPLATVHHLSPNIFPAISDVILQSMAVRRRDRFSSAAAMRTALREAEAQWLQASEQQRKAQKAEPARDSEHETRLLEESERRRRVNEEEQQRLAAEAEQRRIAEEQRQEEKRRLAAEAEQRRIAEERQRDAERRRRLEAEQQRMAEERRREEERQRLAAEAEQRRIAEERRREEERRLAAEAEQRRMAEERRREEERIRREREEPTLVSETTLPGGEQWGPSHDLYPTQPSIATEDIPRALETPPPKPPDVKTIRVTHPEMKPRPSESLDHITTPSMPSYQTHATPPRSSGGKVIAIVVSILIVVGLSVAGVVWYVMSSSQTDTGSTSKQDATGKNNTPAKTVTPPAGMAYVPGGDFTMGRDDGDEYERPAHKMNVKAFFIDTHEVTNEDYRKFIAATNHRLPPGWVGKTYVSPEEADFPVRGVNWDDANDYAKWAGKRLPTEEEWEFAARGTDGRRYPWGNDWRPGLANANHANSGTVAVGLFKGASPFGAVDMVGNAWEWTATSLQAYPGGQIPQQLPLALKVIRGGTFESNENQATCTYRRGWPARDAKTYSQTGFRCAKDVGN
jgi:formylglycine-generating enzyme required for sulfatase activity